MKEFISGAGAVYLYIILAACSAFVVRKCIKIPDELFRKILHFILLGAYIPLIISFEIWWMASVFAVLSILLLYPLLTWAEKLPVFAAFLSQRRDGEIKNSMILALFMMALSTFACWGLAGDRYLVLACVYAWGVGDAFAALVGKRFGKHKIRLKFADRKKSVEGSLAMLLTSSAAVWVILLARGGLSAGACLMIALTAAAVSAFVELCSKGGYDTITCPAAAMAVILPMLRLWGGK